MFVGNISSFCLLQKHDKQKYFSCRKIKILYTSDWNIFRSQDGNKDWCSMKTVGICTELKFNHSKRNP